MTTCSSCSAPIVWALTLKGRRIPLRLASEARMKGNIRIETDRALGSTLAFMTEPGDGEYVNHFADCPNAAAHRTPKKSA